MHGGRENEGSWQHSDPTSSSVVVVVEEETVVVVVAAAERPTAMPSARSTCIG
jgi:hypothetical protein